ncbi:GNAT family N-acetyltransferase, partial [Sphingobacteriales bacterium CHB3]|nr:GNAT family N-acetyltransferase [Sphingobacteriales bacterium CHB3]
MIERAPLGKRDPDFVEKTYRGSYVYCFVEDNGKLIGAGRAISDGVSNSAIYDVVVLPEYQGKGIGTFLLGAVAVIEQRMRMLGWETRGGLVSAERVGDGNMNMTVRVRTAGSSFILKQARPWVVKYPQIAAPVERAEVEAAFYAAVGRVEEVSRRMPRLRGFDAES